MAQQPLRNSPPTLDDGIQRELEARWQRALAFYRERGSALFISYCRFWEAHGFVQQSLAYALVEAGVPVTWIDGAGWRPYSPIVRKPNPLLKVIQMPSLPGRRFEWIDYFDLGMKDKFLRQQFANTKPVVWVQAGIDERWALSLPYIDVFSVFDDPYRHGPLGELCMKARLILCQNARAYDCLQAVHGDKTQMILPPMDMSEQEFDETEEIQLPEGFPKKVMGYVGSFTSDGYDLALFEDFVRSFPDWGFVLMGRTDEKGKQAIARMSAKKNFHYFPWAERQHVAAVWKKLDLTLLFYRPVRFQDGAFPVKVLESLKYGVPCVATRVHKTEALEGVFPRSPFVQTLKEQALKAAEIPKADLEAFYRKLLFEMHPKNSLSRVAEALSHLPEPVVEAVPAVLSQKRKAFG